MWIIQRLALKMYGNENSWKLLASSMFAVFHRDLINNTYQVNFFVGKGAFGEVKMITNRYFESAGVTLP